MPEVPSPRVYRALIKRTAGQSGGSLLHLIRDDAEASLCGIPRSSLTNGAHLADLVCADCLGWFDKRRAVSGSFRKVERP
jgi:hypothetical protein